jgi:hypothetical protein
LTDAAGFALAIAVHDKIAGPDPAVLRERAMARPVRAPLMIGAAPVEMLARIIEALPASTATSAEPQRSSSATFTRAGLYRC